MLSQRTPRLRNCRRCDNYQKSLPVNFACLNRENSLESPDLRADDQGSNRVSQGPQRQLEVRDSQVHRVELRRRRQRQCGERASEVGVELRFRCHLLSCQTSARSFRLALKRGLETGVLKQPPKSTGTGGRFKLGEKASKPKKAVAHLAKKVASVSDKKKIVTKKSSPKKAAAGLSYT